MMVATVQTCCEHATQRTQFGSKLSSYSEFVAAAPLGETVAPRGGMRALLRPHTACALLAY